MLVFSCLIKIWGRFVLESKFLVSLIYIINVYFKENYFWIILFVVEYVMGKKYRYMGKMIKFWGYFLLYFYDWDFCRSFFLGMVIF